MTDTPRNKPPLKLDIGRDELLKADTAVAMNYRLSTELKESNRLTTILLDVFEDQLEIGKLTLMSEAAALLDAQLRQLNRPVLRGGGSVSRSAADRHVDAEYKKFDERRRALRAEQTIRELAVESDREGRSQSAQRKTAKEDGLDR